MVKLFVEGGGDTNALRTACQKGFKTFLEEAGLKGRMPRIVACGSRRNAYDDFCTALANGEEAFLLVDSESVVVNHTNPWMHLAQRKGDEWEKPINATDEQCHLMVQVMETWFLADREMLEEFFGQGFQSNHLPAVENNIELVSKKAIYDALKKATALSKKGQYGKGAHSFRLLEIIDPVKVTQASPWAKRLIDGLRGEL